jgi:hypothetical protein
VINDDKQMADLPPVEQARRALQHVLSRVHADPFVGYYLGHGSQAFALVTEAFAAILGQDVAKVRAEWSPTNARDPRYEPRGDEPPRLDFSDDTVRELRAASALLEDLATADALAACTNRTHSTLDLMRGAERKDHAAFSVRLVAAAIEEHGRRK